MKIQLTYDRPSQISTDLLVIILDSEIRFHDLTGSPLDELARRVGHDVAAKRLKTEYFTALNPGDSRGPAQNVLICSTALSPSYNVWENLKIFVAHSIRLAKDHGFSRVCLLLNTDEAAPCIGKAVE